MATLINSASGNLMTAGTWGTAEAGAGSQQTTISSTGNTTVAYVASSAFTITLNDVIVGVLVHCKRLNTTGTVTVGLSDDNGSTWAREVTVNASDLPASQSWCFFKFGSTITGDGGADYKVGIKGSSAGNATFYRDGTVGNWARLLMTNTAPGAVAAGDILYVTGDLTGAGAGNDYTVTMDDTASTDFGAVTVCQRGILQFGTTASTNYTLKVSGDLAVWASGTLNVGTVATPMPANSTGWLTLDCTTNVEFGLLLKDGSTCVIQGASKTYDRCLLNANASVNDTTLTSDVSTGWADNDKIAVASTTRTAAQCEQGQLNGAASGTTLTVDGFGGVGGGVAYAHSGTSPTQAEIINLTRNVGVRGASATLQTYISVGNLATVDWDWAEFYWHGSATAGKRGLEIATTTGSFNMQRCAAHDFSVASSYGINVTGSASDNFTITNNVFWNVDAYFFLIASTTGASWVFSANVLMRNISTDLTRLNDAGGTFTNNTLVGGSGIGILYSDALPLGTMSGNIVHSCASSPIYFSLTTPAAGSSLSSLTAWRNGAAAYISVVTDITVSNWTLFGNATANIQLAGSPATNVTLDTVVASGDSSFSTPSGISFPDTVVGVRLDNCDFGYATGIKTGHTTSDLAFTNPKIVQLYGGNTRLASSTPVSGFTNVVDVKSFIRISRYQQTAGNHKAWFKYGTITSDSVIFKTATPSERLTPTSASVKLESGPKRKKVDNGATATFSVWVRKSAVGDAGGADYNGNQPRLVLRKNAAAGISSDTVLDTMTVAVGNWEQLSGTSSPAVTDDAVLEAFVDCDFGGAGWINVDDWTVS